LQIDEVEKTFFASDESRLRFLLPERSILSVRSRHEGHLDIEIQ